MSPPPPTAAATIPADSTAPVPPDMAVERRPHARDASLVGIGLIVASTIFFSLGDVAAKAMTATLPPLQVAWFRYLFFCMLVVPTVIVMHRGQAFATRRPHLQVIRGLMVSMSAACFILGLSYLQVADNTAIVYLSPLFITALSIPILGEKVGLRRWTATAVGFSGVLLVVRPGSDAFQLAALFPVTSALIWAFGALLTRHMSDERPETTLAWTALTGFISLSLLMPFVWVDPNLQETGLGFINGLGSAIGHTFVVFAFRRAPASTLAPFSYIHLLFSTTLAYLVFGNVPAVWTVAGGILIAASGLYIAHRERLRHRAR